MECRNPVTQELLTTTYETSEAEFEEAMTAASEAFAAWRDTPVSVRQRSAPRGTVPAPLILASFESRATLS